jgi:hypothetical protein
VTIARRLVELRRAYTGENDAILHPFARAMADGLSKAQRVEVARILDGNLAARLLGVPEPIADPAIRSVVLPDAVGLRQRELETALLLAIGRVNAYRGPGHGWPQRARCRAVHPTADRLVLPLPPLALAPALAELVPYERDGHFAGLAGLRFRLTRRQVELCLVDAEPGALVVVPNTSAQQFAAASAFAAAVTGAPPLADGPHPPSELEQLAIALGRTTGPVALASPLIRRFGLLREADWVSIEAAGPNCLRVDWAGGPTPGHVATMLTHPIAGLPSDRFAVTTNPDGAVTLACTGLGGTLVLRRSAPNPVHALTLGASAAAWAAFRDAAALPNPTAAASSR